LGTFDTDGEVYNTPESTLDARSTSWFADWLSSVTITSPFVADSPDSGLVYPHKVGLASHIRNGNYDVVWYLMAGFVARALLDHILGAAARAAEDGWVGWR
jgi:hypothetical protein